MNYIIVQWKNKIAVRQRTGKDIWQQLFEFCLMETSSAVSADEILQDFEKQFGIYQYKLLGSNTEITQKLTHQLLHFNFITIEVTKKPSLEGFVWMGSDELRQAAFPSALKSQLEGPVS
jgi:A/G-specific adenine glycosylase